MAAIEKVCELSGEYPGHLMYGYKHNQLQIMPKYRKLFRGVEHTLVIKSVGFNWHRGGVYHSYDPLVWQDYEPPFKDEKEFVDWYKGRNNRLLQEFEYTLKVTDPKLQGEVNGEYKNWSSDLSAVKRKLKRLIRCKKLNIEFEKNFQ